MPLTDTPLFRPLIGLYEPSAIQQLADGRFLVIEDEKHHPFSLVTITGAGDVSSTALLPPEQEDTAAAWKLDDLEALAVDGMGYIYALTSHSRDSEGKEKKPRDKLVRFRIADGRMIEPILVTSLKSALLAQHPVLAAAAAIRDVKSDGGLNIEALEISAQGNQLLIGFRSPLLDQQAIIVRVENPTALFERGAQPRLAEKLITLNLGGDGIRALAYIPGLHGYLVVSGPAAREQVQFRLWFWGGRHDEPARPVRVAGLEGFEHAEGISPALIDSRPCIIIVSDDGSRAAGRYANYLLVQLDQLLIAPL